MIEKKKPKLLNLLGLRTIQSLNFLIKYEYSLHLETLVV